MGATAVALYALQRLKGDRGAVHVPDDDPYSPAVRTIAVVDVAHATNKQQTMAFGSFVGSKFPRSSAAGPIRITRGKILRLRFP